MSTMIDDIADYIEDSLLGTVATNIFVGSYPATPSALTACYDTGGGEQDKNIKGIEDRTFQLLVRAATYSAAQTQAEALFDLFHKKENVRLISPSGVYFYFILAIAFPGHIGQDDQGRHEFSMNFRARVR